MKSRHGRAAPKGLPRDCYSSRFVGRCTVLERQLLGPAKAIGVESLLSKIQELD
jgi:hypothetical protein